MVTISQWLMENEVEDGFLALIGDIQRYQGLRSHLGWDQETLMPEGGTEARGQMMAWLAMKSHQLLTGAEMGALLEDLNSREDISADMKADVREITRSRTKALRLPEEHVRKSASIPSRAMSSWAKARAESDFSIFEGVLEELVELARERIELLRTEEATPYDVLLDDYERGMTVADYDVLFKELEDELVPLLKAINEAGRIAPGIEIPEDSTFPQPNQEAFCRKVAESYGFDFSRGRMDASAHPFSAGLWPGDTRFTTRYDEKDPFSCIGAVMHETGHALYEQGLSSDHSYTPRGQAVSLGVHESQSRLWENQIGRSSAYWEIAGDWFREHFTDCPEWTDEQLYRIINRVVPGFIRVEADEVSYNLHVMLRYEVEKAIFNDGLPVSEIPSMWNRLFKNWFDIDVEDDSMGCLQDVHWSMFAFGYFPTYTLGNLYAAQIMDRVCEDLGDDVDSLIRRERMDEILSWLQVNIHERGSLLEPAELVTEATGRKPSSRPFLDYVKRKYSEIHNL